MFKINRDFPVKIFLLSWLLIGLLYNFGLLTFQSIEINTVVTVFLSIFFVLLGFYSPFLNTRGQVSETTNFFLVNSNITKMIFAVQMLSIISLLSLYVKMREFSTVFDFDMNLKGFTDLRNQQYIDYEKGSSIWGIISSITSGFPILSGVIANFHSDFLSKKHKYILNTLFILGIISTFTSGGRFGAFFGFLIWFFNFLLLRKKKNLKPTKSNNYIRRLVITIAILGLIYIFGLIFLDRMGESKEDRAFIELYLQELGGVIYNTNLINSLSEWIPFPVLFVFMMFQYYFTHSIYQLDILLNAPYPVSAPYLNAYQFYPFFLLFNKIGFKTISIEQILFEIINPGVYFTYIGGFFLDYGIYGHFIASFLFGIMFGVIWKKKLYRLQCLKYHFASLLVLLFLFNAPILSVFGTSIFPGLLISCLFLFYYEQ